MVQIEALRTISDEFHTEAMEDEKSIDFSSVGLYLAGLQIVFTIVCCGCASVLCCWLMPHHAISAVRTLAITTAIGILLIRKPLRIGRVRGVTTMFNALRPSVGVYILALVLEQLVHTCVVTDDMSENHGMFRRVVYHIISIFLIMSGFARARSPRSESDMPFLITIISLLATALLPPPAVAKSGPLCEPTTLLGAGERVLRALLFSALYVVLVYAAAPGRNVSNELFICVARATAACIWVLSATAWALPLAPLQAAIVLFSRLNHDGEQQVSDAASYEHVPLRGAQTPDINGSTSDVECGSLNGDTDADALKAALAARRALHTPVSVSSTNGLSFNFGSSNGAAAINVAAIAAREAAMGGV